MNPMQPQSGGLIRPFAEAFSSPNNVVKGFTRFVNNCSRAVAVPLTMVLHPNHGSQYIPPLLMIFGWMLFQASTVVSGVYQVFQGHMSAQPIGMGILTVGFWVLSGYHSVRIWRLMLHTDRESDGEDEGPPLAILGNLTDSWMRLRIVYEPLAVAVVVVALYFLQLIAGFTALYLLIAAMALSLSCFLTWYESWEFQRDILNKIARAKQIEAITQGRRPPRTIGPCVMAAFSPQIPTSQKAFIAGQIAGLTPEMQAMITPPETPAHRA